MYPTKVSGGGSARGAHQSIWQHSHQSIEIDPNRPMARFDQFLKDIWWSRSCVLSVKPRLGPERGAWNAGCLRSSLESKQRPNGQRPTDSLTLLAPIDRPPPHTLINYRLMPQTTSIDGVATAEPAALLRRGGVIRSQTTPQIEPTLLLHSSSFKQSDTSTQASKERALD